MEKLVNAYAWVQAQLKSEKGQGMVEYALVLVFIVALAAYFLGADSDGGLKGGVQNAVDGAKDQLNNGTGTSGGASD